MNRAGVARVGDHGEREDLRPAEDDVVGRLRREGAPVETLRGERLERLDRLERAGAGLEREPERPAGGPESEK